MANRIGKGDRNCVWCEDNEEKDLHIFKNCHFIRRFAFAIKWGCRLDHWVVNDVKELVALCIDPRMEVCGQNLDKNSLSIFLSSLLYFVWKYRNDMIFTNLNLNQDFVLCFNQMVDEFLFLNRLISEHPEKTKEFWSTPPFGWWKVNTDAAFYNGQAGIAFIVRDWKGKTICLASKVIYCGSPFEA